MEALKEILGAPQFALALRVLLLALVAWGGFRLIDVAQRIIERRIGKIAYDPARKARLDTLLDAGVRTAQLIVLGAIALMILYALGINIGPVLTGVGVAGLALSLGAQALIKDFINGFLILLEDQYRVGDVVRVGATEGTVEHISLRTTSLRDLEGRLWIIPNGDIRILSNATRNWSRAVLDLNLAFTGDIRQAVDVLQEAMRAAAEDPALSDLLLEPPEVEGWSGSNDWSVQVRLKAKTKAGQQWAVTRILRERALDALGRAGISVAARIPIWEDESAAGG